MKHLACGMAQTLFLQLIQSKIDMFIILDRLCLSILIFCTLSGIGISVKGHIGTSLVHACYKFTIFIACHMAVLKLL